MFDPSADGCGHDACVAQWRAGPNWRQMLRTYLQLLAVGVLIAGLSIGLTRAA